MKILILGSEGFIGKHCALYFAASGYEVTCADIHPSCSVKLPYIRLDPINPDYTGVFKSAKFNACINASGSANVGFSLAQPSLDFQLNVKNVERMLEAIALCCPSCRFLNFSSAAVYGNPLELPVSENATLNPLSPYGENKLKSEVLLRSYHQQHGLSTSSLRIFSAYGPGLKKQIFWDLYKKSLAPGEVVLFGTGKESRDFIFITDLCNAIETIFLKADFRGESINVASGVEQTIAEVAQIFMTQIAPDKKISFNGLTKEGDPIHWRANIEILKSFGFQTNVKIEEGIKKYTSWLQNGGG